MGRGINIALKIFVFLLFVFLLIGCENSIFRDLLVNLVEGEAETASDGDDNGDGVTVLFPIITSSLGRIFAIVIDSNYVYVAGHDSSAGGSEDQWRIEKRDKTTGALVNTFDSDGVVLSNPSSGGDYIWAAAVDENYIYVAGSDNSLGNSQWRIEKRDITTGALVNAFNTNGIVQSNPGGHINAIAIDSNYVYTAGTYVSASDYQWRIEKRNITTGALVNAFDTDGIVQSNPNGNYAFIESSAVDANYIYVAGYDDSLGNEQWRIEKRNKTTGALVNAFDTDGVVQSNPISSGESLNAVAIDSNYIYAAGFDSLNGNQWRVEKRDKTTGALVNAFDTDGVVQSNPTSSHESIMAVAIDSNYIYAAGYDYKPGNMQWRIEKRDITTGALISAFDSDGVVQSSDGEYISAIAIDSDYIYAAGCENVGPADDQWRIERRDIATGELK